MTELQKGDRVRHRSHAEFGLGTVMGRSPKYPEMTVVEFEKTTGTGHNGDGLGRMDFCWRTSMIDVFTLVEKAKPAIKVVVGSHVRHLEHPEYGNGRVRFIHSNGTSLAVEFEKQTSLFHSCAGHTKDNHGRWTKAGSLEMINPFKVGDTVSICGYDERVKEADGGIWYSPDFAGQQGTIIGVYSDCVDVKGTNGRQSWNQYVHPTDLTLVKVDPVEAVRKATPKVRTITFKTGSQCDRLVKYMLSGEPITPLKARSLFGTERLAARIFEIKKAGHKVKTVNKADLNGKVYAEYSLRKAGRVAA